MAVKQEWKTPENRESGKMIEITAENFSLAQICSSGQCFRMSGLEDGTYRIIAGNRYLEARQQGNRCSFDCGEPEYYSFWERYFDLGQDYGAYIERINPNDAYLKSAAKYGSGIRILHQDLWEMIVTFLISQQNNIVRIRCCIQNICESYGEACVNARGEVYYAFPRPEALAVLAEDDLKPCNLGYRSKYVVRAAQSVVAGTSLRQTPQFLSAVTEKGIPAIDLEAVSRMSYKKAKEELLKLFGVGEKVADCICLFGLHHLQAFPIDTHIHQVLQAHYKRGFPNRRYHGIQGVMQQYIFYYAIGQGTEKFKKAKAGGACLERKNTIAR